jgi:hypothetical protein
MTVIMTTRRYKAIKSGIIPFTKGSLYVDCVRPDRLARAGVS